LEDAVLASWVLKPAVYVAYYDSSIVTTRVFCHKGTKAQGLISGVGFQVPAPLFIIPDT